MSSRLNSRNIEIEDRPTQQMAVTRKIAAAPIMLPLPYRSPPARVVLASMGGMAVAT